MKSETIVHWWDGMSRNRIVDELIAYLSSDFCGTDYDNVMGAFNALRSPTPDPDTGLVPCGCGGKAKIWLSDFTRFTYLITDYEVGCTECAMTTGWVRGKQENAIKVWNTAMGWRVEG